MYKNVHICVHMFPYLPWQSQEHEGDSEESPAPPLSLQVLENMKICSRMGWCLTLSTAGYDLGQSLDLSLLSGLRDRNG